METDEMNSMIEVTSATHLKYPLRIKLRVHIIPPEPGRMFTVVAARRFQQSVLFHNLGSIRTLRENNIPWQQVEIFMNEHSNDVWVDGQRVSLELCEGAHGPPILYIVGRYHLDDLTIEEISPSEVPDIHTFVDALEKIPQDKRVGRIEVNDLPSGRVGKKVELNFCSQGE